MGKLSEKMMGKLRWSANIDDLAMTPFVVASDDVPEPLRNLSGGFPYRSERATRIVVLRRDSAGQGNFKPPVLFAHINDLNLPSPSANDQDQENFILKLYDLWIEKLIERRCGQRGRLSLSIFFEDPHKARTWTQALEPRNTQQPPWLGEAVFPENNPGLLTDLRDLNIWRHVSAGRVARSGHTPLYYEYASYHNAFFSFLYSVEPDSFHGRYVLRQLAEAALLRILVVDDRIASAIWAKGEENRDLKITELKYMGISIVRTIWIDGHAEYLAGNGKAAKDKAAKDWVEMVFDLSGKVKEIKREGKEDGGEDFDILFIHQTIFEKKIAPQLRKPEEKNNLVAEWKQRIPYIVFHSGRGKQQEKLPGNVAFLEYSVLQEHLLQEPSKFFLTQIAMSARA